MTNTVELKLEVTPYADHFFTADVIFPGEGFGYISFDTNLRLADVRIVGVGIGHGGDQHPAVSVGDVLDLNDFGKWEVIQKNGRYEYGELFGLRKVA